jgi:hypothetical protein
MLGASPHSDLLAHLFGLAAGLVVGLFAALATRSSKQSSLMVQIASIAIACVLIIGSWTIALHVPSTPYLVQ